jgi:hypothetical protein
MEGLGQVLVIQNNQVKGARDESAEKYRARLLTPDEYQEWNDFVDASPHGTLFHKTWWLEIVASAEQARLEIIGCFDTSGQLIGGLPLCYFSGTAISPERSRHPILTPYLGPILKDYSGLKGATRIGYQKEILSRLLSKLSNCGDISFSMHYLLTDGQPLLWHGFSLSVGYTYVLNLQVGIETIWEQTDSRIRNDVRRAQKRELQVVTERPLSDFLELNHLTFKRQGLRMPYSDELIQHIYRAVTQRTNGAVFYAEDAKGELYGAVFIVWDSRSAYYLAGGLHPDRKSSGAATLALWEAITQMASRRLQRFDFEGSDVPGIEMFFRGFGGELVPRLIATRTKSLRASLERDARSYARRARDWFSASPKRKS